MKYKIIFIGGVHGIGKTALCRSICKKFEVIHHSASELIKRYGHIEFAPNARVENIDRNQEFLINAIHEYLDTSKIYLMDGHFCLLNQDSIITKIPEPTFIAISPMAIILLHDDPRNIHSHLKEKNREIYDLDLLVSFQEQESDYSRFVATKLNVPYLKANPSTEREIIDKFIADKLE